ncbi:hypothetical protein PBI_MICHELLEMYBELL_54 [Mycobacterium phage MichelleMyBell]|uniref:Uncharacterized protein n=1 Tax=Mycobacterium phage MichelleMyBell TaxID=1445726 RepID=W0LKC0_9CAUD|nr:hypothetical protein CH20_gp54 [Mycobacterium phage MichelleMyBell]AHG24375.1 hypothetical protein PBI_MICHELLEMYBELL_54 [Mycobacterium phage MichelleMyBell]
MSDPAVDAGAAGGNSGIRCIRTPRTEYAILYSCASETVYGPELVAPEKFASLVEAHSHAFPIAASHGYEYEVMSRGPAGWVSSRGESAADVIRRRWL